MTFNEFGVLVKAMRTYFSKDTILETKESIELWYEELKDLDYQMATAELRKYVALNKFPPTISDIRKCLIDFAEDREPNETQAWEIVVNTISEIEKKGCATKRFEALSPLIQNAVGGRTQFLELLENKNGRGIARSSFIKMYGKLIEKDTEMKMLQPEIRSRIKENNLIGIDEGTVHRIEGRDEEELIGDGWEDL